MQTPNYTIVYEAYPKVSIQDFTPEIEFEFDELPVDAISHYVLKTINKLARQTNALRRHAIIKTQDCVNEYLLEPPDCMEIVAVMGICKIRPNCYNKVVRLTHAPCKLPCGIVHSWYELPNIIHIVPGRCHAEYRVEFAVAPMFDACEVDMLLRNNYYDVILDGVRADLYAMGNKPWSSLQRMEYHKQLFDRGLRKIAVETMLGGQRGALKTKRPVMF